MAGAGLGFCQQWLKPRWASMAPSPLGLPCFFDRDCSGAVCPDEMHPRLPHLCPLQTSLPAAQQQSQWEPRELCISGGGICNVLFGLVLGSRAKPEAGEDQHLARFKTPSASAQRVASASGTAPLCSGALMREFPQLRGCARGPWLAGKRPATSSPLPPCHHPEELAHNSELTELKGWSFPKRRRNLGILPKWPCPRAGLFSD